jgi:hypothetical protein
MFVRGGKFARKSSAEKGVEEGCVVVMRATLMPIVTWMKES